MKNLVEHPYYKEGLKCGRGKNQDGFKALIELVKEQQEAIENKRKELLNIISLNASKLEEFWKNLEDRKKTVVRNFVNQTDNLLIVHPTNWQLFESSPNPSIKEKDAEQKHNIQAISFSWPTAIIFVLTGILSMGTAYMIPDSILLPLLDRAAIEVDEATILALKILFFTGLGSIIYAFIVKVIASKRYQGKYIPYYLGFLLVTILILMLTITFNNVTFSKAIGIFLGLNGFCFLPIGGALLAFYWRSYWIVKKAKRQINDTLKVLKKAKQSLTEDQLSSALNLKAFKAFQIKMEALRLGYLEGEAQADAEDRRKNRYQAFRTKIGLTNN